MAAGAPPAPSSGRSRRTVGDVLQRRQSQSRPDRSVSNLVFTEFYRVLPSFTEFYRVLPSLPSFAKVNQVVRKFYPVLPSFTRFYLVLPGFT